MSKRVKEADFEQRVGTNIRMLRIANGQSQRTLARAMGITAQQMYKYETGMNRLPLHRAYQIACHYNVSLSSLLDGIDDDRMPVAGEVPRAETLLRAWAKLPAVMRNRIISITIKLNAALREAPDLCEEMVDL